MREKGEFMQISHKAELQDLYYGGLLELKREGAMANPHVRAVAVPCLKTRLDVLVEELHELALKCHAAAHRLK